MTARPGWVATLYGLPVVLTNLHDEAHPGVVLPSPDAPTSWPAPDAVVLTGADVDQHRAGLAALALLTGDRRAEAIAAMDAVTRHETIWHDDNSSSTQERRDLTSARLAALAALVPAEDPS